MGIINSVVNGEVCSSISIKDRGFNYGDGLFETIALVDNKLIFWDEHFKRLVNGCGVLGLSQPKESVLKEYIHQLRLPEQNTAPYVIKIVVTRGESERGYAFDDKIKPTISISLIDYPKYKQCYWTSGISLKLCNTQVSEQPQLAGVKHLNRLEQVLARREWADEYQEGIMSDSNGNVIEGVMSNLFIVKDDVVYTPCLNKSGVEGVMRGVVLNLCETKGIITKVEKISLALLKNADEVFLTNSLIGIWPVKSIADTAYLINGKTKILMQALVKNYTVDYASFNI